MADYTSQTATAVPVDRPLFSASPGIVGFKDFAPFTETSTQLALLNVDKVARRVRLLPPDSPYFSISGPTTRSGAPLVDGRVAPGMEVLYCIHFKPQEPRDYTYDIVVVTEREKFLVPIRAQGPRAFLSFPDSVAFESTAVKSDSSRTMVVRNVGSAPAAFALSCKSPFTVTPASGVVPVGGTLQVSLSFTPGASRSYEADLQVRYTDTNISSYVALSGEGHDVDIALDTGLAMLAETYIGLESETTIRLANRSELPVHFDWKALAVTAQEDDERQRLRVELHDLQAAEEEALLLDAPHELLPLLEGADYSGGEGLVDVIQDVPSDLRDEFLSISASLSAVRRKYGNLERQVACDPLAFTDGAFSIQPASGTIWAQSVQEFTISFTPSTAGDYAITAFLDVTGRERRLPLELRGQGIGPKAIFAYDVLDVGDVYITSTHRYELQLLNRGDIPADWAVATPSSGFGSRFAFEPSAGHLAVGASATICVDFTPDVLGEFSEVFEVSLRGSLEVLRVHFKGHVIGPTFHADVDTLAFGTVPYEFLNTQSFKLYNTSDVGFVFSFRVPQDGAFTEREFDISPDRVEVAAGDVAEIKVDFVSLSVKEYDYHIAVDVVGVGDDLLSIPISALCIVPHVSTDTKRMQFGTAYLRYPYSQELQLVNNGDQPARYTVLPQDAHHTFVAAYRGTPNSGTVPARGTATVTVSFKAMQLGPISVPLHVKISGQNTPPLLIELEAQGSGPVIETSAPGGMDWGRVPCLTPAQRVLQLTNISTIPAPFKTFIKGARSKFSVDVHEGLLLPGENTSLVLTADLDDTTPHKDELHLLVTEGDSIVVPLRAFGTGTTMFCEHDLSLVDMGEVWTNQTCTRQFMLENKGRRPQALSWVNATQRDALLDAKRAARKTGGSSARQEATKLRKEAVFSVQPPSATLQPRTAVLFTFQGNCKRPGEVEEVLECFAKVADERGGSVVFTATTKAHFMHPIVKMDPPSLQFEYRFEAGAEPAGSAAREDTLQVQHLQVRNVSALQVNCELHVDEPFHVHPHTVTLAPEEEVDVTVEFDPGYKVDRQSHHVQSNLTVSYANHPRRDTVPLSAALHFPNLELDANEIDFGTVLNDTTKSESIVVRNTSECPVQLQWAFVSDEAARAAAAAAEGVPFIPTNQVFDILPIRSLIPPHSSVPVEFVFFGHADRQFAGLAVAQVEGGPQYEVHLAGAASTLGYRLDRSALDFGRIQFDGSDQREFFVHNTGKVEYSFAVRDDLLSRPGVLQVSPATGTVPAGSKQRITVTMRPQVPGPVEEFLVVEVAHFPPVELPVTGEGVYPVLSLGLPRVVIPQWAGACAEAVATLQNRAEKLQAAALDANLELLPGVDMATPSALAALHAAYSDVGSELAQGRAVLLKPQQGLNKTAIADLPSVASISSKPLPGAGKTSRSTQQAAQVALQLDVESEAHRTVFTQYLNALDTGASPKTLGEFDLLPVVSTGARAARGKRGDTPAERFVSGRFVCDLGHVILGSTVKRSFTVTNTGASPASFSLDKTEAAEYGFSLEPSRVTRLGEMESVEFKITLKADPKRFTPPKAGARSTVKVMPRAIDLGVPVNLMGGPAVMLQLVANITHPEVQMSPSTLDFGQVMLGHERIVTVQLHNPSPIAAEWGMGKPIGSPVAARDTGAFTFSPSSGRLGAGKSTLVQVIFRPTAARPWSSAMPLKVAQQPFTNSITCRGKCFASSLDFTPAAVNLGPVLPCAEPVTAAFTVRNPNAFAVEVFSVDFDEQYVQEEQVLGAAGHTMYGAGMEHPAGTLAVHQLPEDTAVMDTARRLQLPLRESGAGLSEDVVANFCRMQALEHPSPEVSQVLEWLQPPARQCSLLAPRNQGTARNFVLLAPPGFATEHIATELAARVACPIVSLDAAVEWARQGLGGEALRHSVECLLAAHLQAEADKAAAADSGGKGKDKAKKPSKGKEVDVALDAPQDVFSGNVPGSLPPAAALPRDVLADVLRSRAQQQDAANGIVLPGVDSHYSASPADAAGAVADAFAGGGGSQLTACIVDVPAMDCVELLQGRLTALQRRIDALAAAEVGGEPAEGQADDAFAQAAAMSADDAAAARAAAADEAQVLEAVLKPATPPPVASKKDKPAKGAAPPPEEPKTGISALPPALAVYYETLLPVLASLANPAKPSDDNALQEALNAAYAAGVRCWHQAPSIPVEAAEAGTQPPSADDIMQALSTALATSPMVHRIDPLDSQDATGACAFVPISPPSNAQYLGEGAVAPDGQLFLPGPMTVASAPRLPLAPEQRKTCAAVFDISELPPAEQDGTDEVADAHTRPASAASSHSQPTAMTPMQVVAAVKAALSLPPPKRKARWLIPAGAEQHLQVAFASSDVGQFDSRLTFAMTISGSGQHVQHFSFPVSGVAVVPSVSNDPRNLFMSRTKMRPARPQLGANPTPDDLAAWAAAAASVKRKFVLSRGEFDFGAVCCLKSATGQSETLRLTNNGVLPATVRLSFAGGDGHQLDADPTGVTGLVGSQYVSPSDPGTGSVFSLDTTEIASLAAGATAEIQLKARPVSAGCFSNAVIVSVDDNPSVVQIPVSCVGVKPTLHVQVLPPPEQITSADAEDQIAPSVLDFGKLLTGQSAVRQVRLVNTCALPVQWTIPPALQAAMPPHFRVMPSSGTLPAGGSSIITVQFSSATDAVVYDASSENSALSMLYHLVSTPLPEQVHTAADADGLPSDVLDALHAAAPAAAAGGKAAGKKKGSKPGSPASSKRGTPRGKDVDESDEDALCAVVLPLVGEAYTVQAAVQWDGPQDGSLAFGTLKVGQSATRSIKLANKGKYPVQYITQLPAHSPLAGLLTFEPADVTLQPGQDSELQVTFHSKHHESVIQHNRDLHVRVLEAETQEQTHEFHVEVSGEAVFSKPRLVPSQSINFGAVRFGSKRSRTVEVHNDGAFPFSFRWAVHGSQEDTDMMQAAMAAAETPDASPAASPRAGSAASKSKKPAAKGKAASGKKSPRGGGGAAWGEGGALEVPGQHGKPAFVLTPASGEVAPGGTAVVTINYQAEGAHVDACDLRVHVSGSDVLGAGSAGPRFALRGESCIPGLDPSDWAGLFEEQQVLASLEDVPRAQGDTPLAASEQHMLEAAQAASCFGLQQQTFSFGTVVPASHPKGKVERVRINNPRKVPARVQLQVVSLQALQELPKSTAGKQLLRNMAVADADREAHEQDATAFQLGSTVLDIPAHEHRYLDIKFISKGFETRRAAVLATVEGGVPDEGGELCFGLLGRSVLPSIAVVDPLHRADDGSVLLQFGKTPVGDTKEASVVFRNDGAVTATATFKSPSSHAFDVPLRHSSITLAPKQSKTVTIKFQPNERNLKAAAAAAVSAAAAAAEDTASSSKSPRAAKGSKATTAEMQAPTLSGGIAVQHSIHMTVMHNTFGSESIQLQGIGFQQALALRDVPAAPADWVQPDASIATDLEGNPLQGAAQSSSASPRQDSSPRGKGKAGKKADPKSKGKGGKDKAAKPQGATDGMSEQSAPDAPHVVLGVAHMQGESTASCEQQFQLCNNSEDTLLVQWPSHERLVFSPNRSHLPPRATANVTVRAVSTGVPLALNKLPVAAQYWPIVQEAGVQQWSSNDTIDRREAAGSAAARAAQDAVNAQHQTADAAGETSPTIVSVQDDLDSRQVLIRERVQEPAFTYSDAAQGNARPSSTGSSKASGKKKAAGKSASPRAGAAASGSADVPCQELPIAISALLDAPSCELSQSSVAFKPTLMFQERSHTFEVRNTSFVPAVYRWALQPAEGYVDSSGLGCPFTIQDASGVLQPAQTKTFTAMFSPLEVDDYFYDAVFLVDANQPAAVRFAHAAAASSLSVDTSSAAAAASTLRLAVRGRSQRPIVHLDLPKSTYLAERSPALPGPDGAIGAMDASVKALEMVSLGTGVKNTTRFHVINPTSSAYEFVWEKVNLPASGVQLGPLAHSSSFHCATGSGAILPGHRSEMIFEFTPMSTDVCEAFYHFRIPQLVVDQVVLLCGKVNEPRVSLDTAVLNFKQLLVGATSSETITIMNQEHLPFAFDFDTSSLDVGVRQPRRGAGSAAAMQPLVIKPASGVVPAKGSVTLEVHFHPTEEKTYNYNVACRIKKKPTVLNLNVKGEGYAIHDSLQLQDSGAADAADQLLTPERIVQASFGEVAVHEQASKRVTLTNTGKATFDFAWKVQGTPVSQPRGLAMYSAGDTQALSSAALAVAARKAIRVTPDSGKVPQGGRTVCSVDFAPDAEVNLDGLVLCCTVAGTKQYNIGLSGLGKRPRVQLSWSSHDFGACFLPAATGSAPVPVTEQLTITNMEHTDDVSVECLVDTQLPFLTVGLDAAVLAAGESLTVPVTFLPREAKAYTAAIPFEINGRHTVTVSIAGSGVPMQVELVNPADKRVHLGALRVGQAVQRSIKVVNRSVRETSLAVHALHEGDLMPLSSLGAMGLSVSPAFLSLAPRGQGTLTVQYAPRQRAPPMDVQLVTVMHGAVSVETAASDARPLLSMHGSCQGMQVQLSMDVLNFGAVCVGSRLSKTLQILNTGDIGTHWSWQSARSGDFSVSPSSGFVAPQSDSLVTITFHPAREAESLQHVLQCSFDDFPSSKLQLFGECVSRPAEASEQHDFTCAVRASQTLNITLPRNESDQPIRLTPVFDNDFWSGPVSVEVPPKGTAEYPITFKPLRMTQAPAAAPANSGKGKKQAPAAVAAAAADTHASSSSVVAAGALPEAHVGSLFIALPDGSGVLHSLRGTATAPPAEDNLKFDFPAKQAYSFVIPVRNWLQSTQRFSVSWSGVPAAATMRSARSIDVPGLATREHKMTFFAYTAGLVDAVVTFTNESTGEYLLFNVQLTASQPPVLDTVAMQAVLRQAVQHTIVVENPLASAGTAVAFESLACEHPCVRVAQLEQATGKQEVAFQVEYRPLFLVEEEEHAELLLSSPQLGEYKYALRLKVLPSGPEGGLALNTSLGRTAHDIVRFQHFAAAAGKYSVHIENSDCGFSVPTSVDADAATVGPASQGGLQPVVPSLIELPVTFEPLAVGKVHTDVTVRSEDGMQYKCELRGEGKPPQPAGPFHVPAGGSTTITFKNTFSEEHSFAVRTDSSVFTATPPEISLAAKSTTALQVSIASQSSPGGVLSGKVVVQCTSKPGIPPWVFYVQHDPQFVEVDAGNGGAAAGGRQANKGKPKGKGKK